MTYSSEALSRLLVDSLIDRGDATEQSAAAIHAVPRHLFIPDRIWRHERGRTGNDLMPLDRADQPDEWLRMVYSGIPINTQVNDGYPDPDGTGLEVTSSSSQPAVMAGMLDELGAQPGENLLEIDTGTGWNAALLAHIAGAANITTVELDPAVAAHARKALDGAGYSAVSGIVADGAAGWPGRAPYKRVISTVGVSAIQYAWVEQTASGGRIVAPLHDTFRSPGIATLVCDGGGTASGRLAGPASFMELRAEQIPRVAGDFAGPLDQRSITDIHPHDLVGDRDAATAIGMRLPSVRWVWQQGGDLGTLWLYGTDGVSWARSNCATNAPTRSRRPDRGGCSTRWQQPTSGGARPVHLRLVTGW